MHGIFIVLCHNISEEEIINPDIHAIKETFDLVFTDVVRLDFPKLEKYTIRYCIPSDATADMLPCIHKEKDDVLSLINIVTITL